MSYTQCVNIWCDIINVSFYIQCNVPHGIAKTNKESEEYDELSYYVS